MKFTNTLSPRFVSWLVAIIFLSALPVSTVNAQSVQGVAVLVNDQPISNFDIDQRMKLMKASTGKPTNARMREEVIQQLIDENLKLQEARRLNIAVPSAQIDATVSQMAASSGMNITQFKAALKQIGINIVTLRNRIEAETAWRDVIRARYQSNVQIREQDVEIALGLQDNVEESTRTEYKLQQIILLIRQGAPRSVLQSRQREATRIRRDFKSCETSRSITIGMRDVVIKPTETFSSSTLPAETNTELNNIQVGGITRPQTTADGILLLGICARKEITDTQQARAVVQNELVNQEFTNLALRHLRDLRQDATIERR